ncbi:MAG: DUF1624 domain-containing protein [Betaproteobacteria bacterium]|nr:DUF1624 domain-containing protein [Betaproteobacteria bacterium]
MPSLDTLRGIAIVAMAAYHFCFDLRYFGFLRADLEHDWRWITARTLILSTFLLVAGASMVLAERDRQSARRRWLAHAGVIAIAALAVSAGSYLMFPQTWIWFGVLHAIAASLVIARPFVRRPAIAMAAGVAIIVAGLAFQNAAFDNRALGWLGFMTAKPATEDYVPLFPWTGVLLLGTGLGHLLVRTRFAVLGPLERAPRLLAFLGRHSLAVYLVHQPILIGALWTFVRIRAA